MATYLIYECRRKKTLKILGIISQPCFSHSRNGFLVNKRTTFSMRTDKTRRSRAPDPLDADKRDGGKLSRGRRRFGGLAVPGDLCGSWRATTGNVTQHHGVGQRRALGRPFQAREEPGETERGSKRPDHVNPEEATELWAGGDGDRVPGQHGGGGVCFSLRRALRRRRHLPSPSPGVTALDAAGRPTGGAEGQAGSVRRGPGRSPRGRRAGGEKPGDLGLFLRWNQTDTWTC